MFPPFLGGCQRLSWDKTKANVSHLHDEFGVLFWANKTYTVWSGTAVGTGPLRWGSKLGFFGPHLETVFQDTCRCFQCQALVWCKSNTNKSLALKTSTCILKSGLKKWKKAPKSWIYLKWMPLSTRVFGAHIARTVLFVTSDGCDILLTDLGTCLTEGQANGHRSRWSQWKILWTAQEKVKNPVETMVRFTKPSSCNS